MQINKINHQNFGMDITAKEFCGFTKYNYNLDFLVRNKDTKKQYNLILEKLHDYFDNLSNDSISKDNVYSAYSSTSIYVSE